MKITKKRLKRIIQEEISAIEDRPLDVEAEENAWAGGDDLVEPIDHLKAGGGPEIEPGPGVLPTAEPIADVLQQEGSDKLQVYLGQNDLGKLHKLPGIVFECYYDAVVSGRRKAAIDILEEHLDKRFPGWCDYEWRS